MKKDYTPNKSRKYIKYHKPKLIKSEKMIPPVTVNFAPPAVKSIERKFEE